MHIMLCILCLDQTCRKSFGGYSLVSDSFDGIEWNASPVADLTQVRSKGTSKLLSNHLLKGFVILQPSDAEGPDMEKVHSMLEPHSSQDLKVLDLRRVYF